MKRNMRRFTAVLLAGAMAASLGACSKGSGSAETTKAAEAAAAAADGESTQAETGSTEEKGAYADYSNGFTDRVTIQIPVYDRAYEGWNVTDNYYTRWIQQEFGEKYNVNVEFVAITRNSQVNDYMQMLASGKAPDIIFHYDMPQMLAYYAEGAMQKLDLDEIAYYAPTYWENMGESISTYSTVDDGNYFVFAERPDAYNQMVLIRKDWLDAVNMEMPTCLEELNEVLAAWKEAGLGRGAETLKQNAFMYDYPFRDWNMSEEEHALYSDLSVAAMTWEPTHQYLKNLNYQYNHDLIDTEFYLNTDEAASQADFVSGSVGMFELYLTNNTPVIDSLLANDPKAEVAYMPLSARTPKGNKPQSRAFWPFGMIMGINHSTTDEERAAIWMYLEWMSQDDNLFFLQNGVEGECYTLNDEGLAVKNADYKGEAKLSNNNNKDYWCLVTETAEYANEELNYKANINNWAPVGYEYLVEDSYKDYTAISEYRTPDPLFSVVISSVAEYKAELNEKWKELYVKCAMAPEADFEATYEAACQDYLDAGYQQILDEKQAAIDAGNYR